MKPSQKDKFWSQKPTPGCYIINLQSSTDGGGTHWTGLSIKNNVAIYFDPYGLPIPTPILKFLLSSPVKLKILYSTDEIQPRDSIRCGWYVLFFLWYMTVLNVKNHNSKLLLNRHNAIYSLDNKQLNDRILQKLIANIPRFGTTI